MSKSILPMFSSRSFMVSGLTFKSSTLFELSCVYSMRKCFVSVLFSHWVVSDSWRPMDCRMPSYSVLHYLLGFAQTHVHWGSNAIYLTLCHSLLCLQSFPTSVSFPVSWLFPSDCQSIGASAWSTVLPMNIRDWFPLGWNGWISLQSQGLLRVFFNTTVQRHHFFSVQPSLWSTSHICTWLLEKP